MRPFRLALVGAGRMGSTHAPALTTCAPGLELAAVVEPSDQAVARLRVPDPAPSRASAKGLGRPGFLGAPFLAVRWVNGYYRGDRLSRPLAPAGAPCEDVDLERMHVFTEHRRYWTDAAFARAVWLGLKGDPP